jgi:hypothetical protein
MVMRAAFLALPFVLASCASHYGNFIKPEYNQPWLNTALASEFQALIASKSPAAWTQVTLAHEADDLFGQGVTANLRRTGYAVAEYHPEQISQGGLTLLYKIDHFGADEYLISVVLAGQTYSRIYAVNQAALTPSGRWTKLEIAQ